MTGIKTSDEDFIAVVQGNYFDINRMVWTPNQQLVLETPDGIKLYKHPNGSIYAERLRELVESLVKIESNE